MGIDLSRRPFVLFGSYCGEKAPSLLSKVCQAMRGGCRVERHFLLIAFSHRQIYELYKLGSAVYP